MQKIIDILNEASMLSKIMHMPECVIDKKNNDIILKRLHWGKLQQRIKEVYSEKNMFRLFDIKYRTRDLALYNKKKIPKSKMKIDTVKTDAFFSLETMILFEALYKKYKYKYYDTIAQHIYEESWVSKKHPITTKVDLSKLKELKYELKPYQLEFIEHYPVLRDSDGLDGYLLSFDQGLGKTLTSIALSLCLKKDITIIICPNSLKGNWLYEIKQYFNKYSTNDEKFMDEVFAIGESKWVCNKNKLKYLIVNHEAIPSSYDYIRQGSNMIIVDESHFFRNIDGKRSKELVDLKRKIDCRDNLLMSGTPIKALPNEMCPVMMMIDPLFTDSVAAKYKKMFNVEGLNASDMVKRRFTRMMHRRTKEEVLSLPDKLYHTLELNTENGEKYNISNVKAEINKEFTSLLDIEQPKFDEYEKNYLYLLSKYHKADQNSYERYIKFLKDLKNGRVMGYHELDIEFFNSFSKTFVIPYITGNDLKDFKRAETLYLRIKESCMGRAIGKILPKYRTEMFIMLWESNKEKFIKMINDNPKKTVIYSSLLNVVKHISDSLHDEGIYNVQIIGETKNRSEMIQRFKNEDICEVLIASSQTLSTGVTLTEASQMFFFGTPWRDTDFEQCCDRIYRIGQTSDVNIYTILLNTGSLNLSTRMDNILNWSSDMFNGFIDKDNI